MPSSPCFVNRPSFKSSLTVSLGSQNSSVKTVCLATSTLTHCHCGFSYSLTARAGSLYIHFTSFVATSLWGFALNRMLINVETLLTAFVLGKLAVTQLCSPKNPAGTRLVLNVVCVAALGVLAVPTLLFTCAYHILSQAVGAKRRLQPRHVAKLYILLCVANAAYSSMMPQHQLPSEPQLHPDFLRASGLEPTLPQRAVSQAKSSLGTISAPHFLVNLGLPTPKPLPGSYSLEFMDATVSLDPTSPLPPSSILRGSTSTLWSINDAFAATVLFADDNWTAVAVYPAKFSQTTGFSVTTTNLDRDYKAGKTTQMPAFSSFGEAILYLEVASTCVTIGLLQSDVASLCCAQPHCH